MTKRSLTPGDRKRRIVRDAVLLLVVLILLAFTLDFPMLTARQALKSTQTRYLFEDSRIIARIDDSYHDHEYILKKGDWYAWCALWRFGPFWQPGLLVPVPRDPSRPLTALTVAQGSANTMLVVSSNPDIAEVELEYPVEASGYTFAFRLKSVRQLPLAENCWWFALPDGYWRAFQDEGEGLRLRGYDAAGRLVYESPRPESWDLDYTILNDS